MKVGVDENIGKMVFRVKINGLNDTLPERDKEVTVTTDSKKDALSKIVARYVKDPRFQAIKLGGISVVPQNIWVLVDYIWDNPDIRDIYAVDIVENRCSILESQKDLRLYKRLLFLFNDYCEKFPATGVDRMFKCLVANGMKAMPQDDDAINILATITHTDKSVPSIIQDLLNVRFADLQTNIRPIYIGRNNKREVAFWSKDGKIFDKVISLLDLGDFGSKFWSDAEGNKVAVIDLKAE